MNAYTESTTGQDYRASQLWLVLHERSDSLSDSIQTMLKIWMPKIQTVLTSGGTSPLDFTLHDAGHAFRVAERMFMIISDEVLPGLSSYELALLLLAAYLHDIGMTPECRKVALHYQYLLTGTDEELTSNEMDQFQQWLDNEEEGATPPLANGPPMPRDLQLAAELVTHYCRHKHNDWSKEWMMKNPPPKDAAGMYPNWMSDLIRLCQSHHEDKSTLIKSSFNPRAVGSGKEIVHLRYLACVLRIADILEFDPERTPEVLLHHRNITGNSLLHWQKDHNLSLREDADGLVVSARPTSAEIQHAIEQMIEEINYELRLCRVLADETHFRNAPI